MSATVNFCCASWAKCASSCIHHQYSLRGERTNGEKDTVCATSYEGLSDSSGSCAHIGHAIKGCVCVLYRSRATPVDDEPCITSHHVRGHHKRLGLRCISSCGLGAEEHWVHPDDAYTSETIHIASIWGTVFHSSDQGRTRTGECALRCTCCCMLPFLTGMPLPSSCCSSSLMCVKAIIPICYASPHFLLCVWRTDGNTLC